MRQPLPDLRARAGEPRFRFHGRNVPRADRRTPILATAPTPTSASEVGTAVLRLYDPIDSWGEFWGVSASEFGQALDALDDSVTTIELHLNSPGGEVFEGVAILNQLRAHPARVVAVVDGVAASAASFIACGADELVMSRNTELMIHDALGLCLGNESTMLEMADLLSRLSNDIAAVYAEKAGGEVGDWRAAMQAETWYSADEAVAAGLADSVDGKADEGAKSAQNSFDLSIFEHAGRADAPPPTPVAERAPLPPMSHRSQVQHRMAARRHDLHR